MPDPTKMLMEEEERPYHREHHYKSGICGQHHETLHGQERHHKNQVYLTTDRVPGTSRSNFRWAK